MAANLSLKDPRRIVNRFLVAGWALLGVSLLLIAAALVYPIPSETNDPSGLRRDESPSLPRKAGDIESLVGKIAGHRLIRPAQALAPVKDSGAAGKLLKKLKLEGVVQMGGEHVAYVRVANQGTQALREGQKVLDFVIENVAPGKVTLSLEGVVVTLQH